MQRQYVVQLATLGMLIVGSAVYVSIGLSGLHGAVTGMRDDFKASRYETTVIYKKEPGMKTGTLSKILNGTTISLDYEWDCTVEGWRKILDDWKIICENPPGE